MPELIDTLASYVPALITRQLADDPAPIAEPESQHFPAAVLFADISGFTALTEKLAQRGLSGAEELTQLLNAYFGQLIELIQAHGGDVVKFAGDALLALWPVLDQADGSGAKRLPETVQRAAQCSLEIQQRLNAYEVAEGIRLSLRLSLGAGEILTMRLGGVLNRWEFLVTGQPLLQVGAASHEAQPGDIVLSPEAWSLVQTRCRGEPVASSSPIQTDDARPVRLTGIRRPLSPQATALPMLTSEFEEGLRPYIPGAIRARLAARQSGWLAELRRVTILFVNLPNLDYTMPLQQAQSLMTLLQKALYRYEGSLNKLSVDDKGVTLVAAFGLPPLAHEDDAARGVQAALDIQTALRQQGLRSAIGITTGRAFCGSVGSNRRREYTMIGDVVNLSARLMQAAPDDVLCDEMTYRSAQAAAAQELMLGVDLDGSGGVGDMSYFEVLEPIKVKGKNKPVPVYRPCAQTKMTVEQHPLRMTMVGRKEERKLLTQQLQALQRGEDCHLIIIEGEAGIGKSRLVGDLLEQAKLLGVSSLVGAASAIDKSTPYYAWRTIFKQIFNWADLPDDPVVQRRQVLAQLETEFVPALGPDLIQLAPLLNPVLSLEWPDNELTEQMVGKVRADNTNELLARLLGHVARKGYAAGSPYLVILEDTHWLDSASWGLTLLAAQQVKPLLLVIATRPMSEPLPAEYSQFVRLPRAYKLELNNLSPKEAVTLVCHRLGVSELPPALAELIYNKAQGNPFFSEELVYALRDAGLISVHDGKCEILPKAGDLKNLYLPDTIQGVITSRIDPLPPAQQLTLKVASVIGRVFAFNTLRDVYPIDSDKAHLPEYLNKLGILDITQLELPDPELTYIFKHIITQEVAYNMMLFAQRRDLHRAVAEWYETAHAEDLSAFYGLMAHHWQKADVLAKGIEYLEKAGEQALRTYANEEAIEFFSEALQLADQLESKAVAPSENGAKESSQASLLPQPPARSLQSQRARWEIKIGEAYVNWVKFGEGQAHLERGLELWGYGLPATKTNLVLAILGQIWLQILYRWWPAWRVGRLAHQRDVLLEAARAYEGLTAVYYFANDSLRSLYAAFRSLNLAEAAGPSPELARGYASVGVITSFIPLHRLAAAYCRRALAMAWQVDNLSAVAWASLLSGIYYAGVGDWEQANTLLKQVIEISERLGDHSRWADGLSNLAMIPYFQGHFSQSNKLFDDLAAAAFRRKDAHNEAWALRGQVYCFLPRGKFTEALVCLETLRVLLHDNPHVVDEALNIDLQALLAVVQFKSGNSEIARESAEKALKLLEQTSPSSYLSLPGYAGLAETYLTLWEQALNSTLSSQNLKSKIPPQARKRNPKSYARRACKALWKYTRVFPIGQPRAYLHQGQFEWLSGRPHLARDLWRKSLAAAKRLNLPYSQGLAHYELGRHFPADDPRRQEHLRQAYEILTRLEATYDVERVQIELG